MKNLILILIIIVIPLFSCNTENKKEEIHKNLLGFKTLFLAESRGEENELEKKVKKGNLDIKYINDIIYISYYEELNACGQYDGNIELKNDTIKLKVNLISDEVCTSTSINKITFLIENPDMKKKKAIIKTVINSFKD